MQSTKRVDREERLRLCFVGWGDHVHLERWAGHFSRAGHDVTVLSLSSRPGRYPRGTREYRVGFETRGARWRQLRLRWLLWQVRPDVVHVHWAHFAYDVMHAWKGPTVVTAWGSDIYKEERFSTPEAERLKTALASAAVITCDANDLARRIAEIVPDAAARVQVVQWGVDTEHFRPQGGSERLRSSLGIGDRPVILSPRNFTPLYNQESIVRAFRRVIDIRPDAVLVFKDYHGDQGYRRQVLDIARGLGLEPSIRVIDAIPYEDMPELYRLAVAVVSVPSSDATPMSVLEAMATGAIPICSDLPALREWIADDVNGFLVPAEAPDLLAGRMLAVLQGDLARMAEANRALVRERADQHVHMSRMLDLYRQLRDPARTLNAA